MLLSGSKVTFVKMHLLLRTPAKKVLPLFDTASDRNPSQTWDQNFTFKTLKIFFLLHIAKVLGQTLRVTGTALEGHHSI